MALRPLRITFEIDPAGLIYDPLNPPMLDSLIDWCLSPMVRKNKIAPTRSEKPEEIRLPLGTWHVGEHWGWCTSAILPEGDAQETIRHYRKKFRANRISLTAGMPNLQSGTTREYNLPMVHQLPNKLVAYAIGDRKRIKDLFKRNLRYLGQKRHRGVGRIDRYDIEIIDDDYSLTQNGLAMRWLPVGDGIREVRLRPPYWNNFDRVACCDIGDVYNIPISQP